MQQNVDQMIKQHMALYIGAGLLSETGRFPDAVQWRALFEYPHEGTIDLVSTYVYSKNPVDEMNKIGGSIWEDYDAWMKRYGVKTLYSESIETLFIGHGEKIRWHQVDIKQYANKESFIKALMDPWLIGFFKQREAFVESARSYLMRPNRYMR